MAHNPELDYEFREGKNKNNTASKTNPLLYGDISAGLQPRAGIQARMDPEMMASLHESNKSNPLQKLKYAAVAAAIVVAIALIFYLLYAFGIFSV